MAEVRIGLEADPRRGLAGIQRFTKGSASAFDRLKQRGVSAFGKLSLSVGSIRKRIFGLKSLVIGLAATFGGLKLAQSFVAAGANLEKFKAQLIPVLDGNRKLAEQTLKWVREFAAKTPFMTEEVVSAFIQLKSVGIDATRDLMTNLGDAAFVFDRDIRDVASALVSFETEVLRRLGIEMRRTGTTATLVSGTMRVETENTAEAIRKGILEIWEKRFPGAMKEAENLFTGLTALLKSEWWEFRAAVTEAGVFDFIINGLQSATKHINTLKEEGKLDEWAADVSEGAINAFSGLIEFMTNMPLAFNAVMNALKTMGAGTIAILQAGTVTAQKFVELKLKAPDFMFGPGGREELEDKRQRLIEINEALTKIGTNLLISANANETAGNAWAVWQSKALDAIEAVRQKSLAQKSGGGATGDVEKIVKIDGIYKNISNSGRNLSEIFKQVDGVWKQTGVSAEASGNKIQLVDGIWTNMGTSAAATREVFVQIDGVWTNMSKNMAGGIKAEIDTADAMTKIKDLRKAAETPIIIPIKGEGSKVLPISEKIDDIKTMFGSLENVRPTVTADFSQVSNGIDSVADRINNLSNFTQIPAIQSFLSGRAAQGFRNTPEELAQIMRRFVPSFDTGTPYVKKDTLAFVHKGERITPAAENRGGATIGAITINVQSTDPRAAAREIRAELRRLESRL